MPGYYSCYVGHATITHFEVIFIADFVQAMMRKVFGKQVRENLTDVSLNMLAKGWVKPHYVMLSGFSLMGVGCADVLELTEMSISSHSLFILCNSSGKIFTIAQEQ